MAHRYEPSWRLVRARVRRQRYPQLLECSGHVVGESLRRDSHDLRGLPIAESVVSDQHECFAPSGRELAQGSLDRGGEILFVEIGVRHRRLRVSSPHAFQHIRPGVQLPIPEFIQRKSANRLHEICAQRSGLSNVVAVIPQSDQRFLCNILRVVDRAKQIVRKSHESRPVLSRDVVEHFVVVVAKSPEPIRFIGRVCAGSRRRR